MIQNVSTNYTPRPYQLEIHRNMQRFNVICCHRRFGKTHLALNEIIDQAFRNELKNPQYAYAAPTYGQAKRVAWDLLKDYVKEIPGIIVNEADLRIDIPRPYQRDKIRIILLGAENPGSLKGIYLDGVVLDEYAEMNTQIWGEVIRPALSDRMGWAIFIGTPKGTNHFYEIYNTAKTTPGWYAATYKASETGIIPFAELEAARAVMSDAEYEQEFECSFSAALLGAYYGKEMQAASDSGRILSIGYDPALPVFTYWDLGMDDTTAIWFAQILRGREIRFIDYHEESGMGLDHYARVLQNKGYLYEEHMLPHDGAVRELGATNGRSRMETLRALTKGVRVSIGARQSVEDGIQAARLMIAKSWFDVEKCAKGIEALKSYERMWDSKNKIFQAKAKHNWASHGADAFRVAALGIDENKRSADDVRRLSRNTDSDYSVI